MVSWFELVCWVGIVSSCCRVMLQGSCWLQGKGMRSASSERVPVSVAMAKPTSPSPPSSPE
jgi:hypothetical protein